VPGVAIDTWNFVPIDRMVLRHADEDSGGRPDSARELSEQDVRQRMRVRDRSKSGQSGVSRSRLR